MPQVLDLQAVEQFHRDGFLQPIRVVSTEQAAALRRHLEAAELANGGALRGDRRFKSHLLYKWLADLVRHPQILDVVQDLIGPDILCWTGNWWNKEAHSPSFVSWHQDSQYWGLDTDRLVTAWVALSPATIESGCMRLLTGSHLGPGLPHVDTFDENNMLTRGQAISTQLDESAAVNLQVDSGEVALFSYRIAHASHPNNSDDRRLAYAIRYLPPDARQVEAQWDSAALVRGEDRFGHFEHEPEPSCDFDPVAVEFHRRAEAQQRAILYKGTGIKEHRT
jgi:non-heme Fe2+,alpha-ketoglutarate-dependent halogenase